MVDAAVLAHVDDRARPVAGQVDPADADEVGVRAVDDLAGEEAGVGGARRHQQRGEGEEGDQAAWAAHCSERVTTLGGRGSFVVTPDVVRPDALSCGR